MSDVMPFEVINDIVVVAFAGLLVLAAVGDVRSMTIPNRLCLAVAALWPITLLTSWPGFAEVAWSIGLGTAALFISIGLFAMRTIGGGDAKLASAVSLWAGPAFVGEFLLVTAICGGVVALATLLLRLVGRTAATQPAIKASAEPSTHRTELPYGVAIAGGGIWVALRLTGI